LLKWLGVLPDLTNVANTALTCLRLPKNNNDNNTLVYALFERGLPTELSIDFLNKRILTNGESKNHWPNTINHVSAHSKYDSRTELFHTIEYHVLHRRIKYSEFVIPFHNEDEDEDALSKPFNYAPKEEVIPNSWVFYTEYLPLVHDFHLSTTNHMLFCDSPITLSWNGVNRIPVTFDPALNTYFYLVDVKNPSNYRVFSLDRGIYLFHYAKVDQDETVLVIYASIYENLDFNSLDLKGVYSRLTLDKQTHTVTCETTDELRRLNLDFPLALNNGHVLLRNYNPIKKGIDGFIICDGLEIAGEIWLNDKLVCGEPAIIYLKGDGNPHIICLTYNLDFTKTFILIIDLLKKKVLMEQEVFQGSPLIGFHSIFIPVNQES
jgi:Retinal pigment epithelial membrane protein